MTEFAAQNGAVGAESLAERAAAWIERHDRGEWSESDKSELNAWLAESPAHVIAFLRAEDAWRRADRLSALRISHDAGEFIGERRSISPLLKIVASLVVIALLGVAGVAYYWQPREAIYATMVGGHQTVALADGSRVELGTSTVLHVAANHRTAWLEKGEAYFQIKHDGTQPFAVKSGGYRITDLGTGFAVRNDGLFIKVSLVEGRARLEPTDGQAYVRSALLTPGDVAVATPTSISVTKTTAQSLLDELGWRRGMLIFKHAPLSDAAEEFNRYNAEHIVIADRSVARALIGGSFRTSDVGVFSRAVRDLLGFHVEKEGGDVVISR